MSDSGPGDGNGNNGKRGDVDDEEADGEDWYDDSGAFDSYDTFEPDTDDDPDATLDPGEM